MGEPIKTYVIFNAITMKFYHIEKERNPKCSQCGKDVRRVSLKFSITSPLFNVIKTLEKNGFELDPDFEPIITLLDFNDIQIVDLDQTPIENGLRNCELLTVAGFKGGEIYVTLKFN